MTIVPLDPPARVNLATHAPLVRELAQWLDPDDWPATLVGLIRSAPAGLLADLRAALGRRRGAVDLGRDRATRLAPAGRALAHGRPTGDPRTRRGAD